MIPSHESSESYVPAGRASCRRPAQTPDDGHGSSCNKDDQTSYTLFRIYFILNFRDTNESNDFGNTVILNTMNRIFI